MLPCAQNANDGTVQGLDECVLGNTQAARAIVLVSSVACKNYEWLIEARAFISRLTQKKGCRPRLLTIGPNTSKLELPRNS